MELLTTVEADEWDPSETRWAQLTPLSWRMTYGPSDDPTTYTLRIYPDGGETISDGMHVDYGKWSVFFGKKLAYHPIERGIDGIGNAVTYSQRWMMRHPAPGSVESVESRLSAIGYA